MKPGPGHPLPDASLLPVAGQVLCGGEGPPPPPCEHRAQEGRQATGTPGSISVSGCSRRWTAFCSVFLPRAPGCHQSHTGNPSACCH